jgi:hypothetical protein
LPVLIHDVSPMVHGSFKLSRRSDSISLAGWSAISTTRQGESCGSDARTAIFGSFGNGERRLTIVELLPGERARYIPA